MTESGDAPAAIMGTATNWEAPRRRARTSRAPRRRAGRPGRRGRRRPSGRRTPRAPGRARGRRPRAIGRGSGRRSGDRHRVAGRACRALERQRVEGPRELVRFVGRERLEVEVLVDEDAVHRDPDGMTGERQVGALARHRLHGPGVAADHADLALDQPAPHRRARPGAALVELRVVLLPELAVAGTEQHGVSLARLPDSLAPQRLLHVVHRDHVADGQALAALDGQDVEQDAAREERLQLLDADLFDSVRRADLFLRVAVVVTDLAVTRHHADVTEAVELRADLADLSDEQRSEEHTSELQSLAYLVCRLLLEKKKYINNKHYTCSY